MTILLIVLVLALLAHPGVAAPAATGAMLERACGRW
jgi:hypothetical protein